MAAVFDLAPDPPNVDVHRPRATIEIVSPNAIEERLARADPVLVLRQEAQQLVFLVCELDWPAPQEDLVAGLIDGEVSAAQDITVVVIGAPLDAAADPSQQLLSREREDHEIVHRQGRVQLRHLVHSHDRDGRVTRRFLVVSRQLAQRGVIRLIHAIDEHGIELFAGGQAFACLFVRAGADAKAGPL